MISGATVESSLVLHVGGDRGLSRGGSFVRRLIVQGRWRAPQSGPGETWRFKSWQTAGLDKRLFGADGSGSDGPDGPGESSWVVVAKEADSEDLRACWIDTDKTRSRFKPWGKVVLESAQETFSDSTVSGPPTALPVCRKMLQKG